MEHIIKGFSLYLTGFFLADSLLDCYENEEGLALFCCLLDSQITGALVALLTYVTSLIVVELFATTGTVIIPGAAPGAGEIAKQNSRVFGNLVAYLTTGPGRTAAKRGKFRITVCGSITGT